MKKELEKLAEIRNQDGEVIWSVWLNSNQAREFTRRINQQEGPGVQTEEGKGTGQVPGSNDESMTDAQKRYLFRLLAERGIEGEAAHRHLKEAFAVDSLGEVTKFEASREIDRMLNG